MKRQTILTLIAVIAVIGVATVPLAQNVQAESLVPEWIKTNAGWWADGTVDDTTFLNGIKFLLENDVIDVSSESNGIDVDTLTIGFIPVEKADELTPKAQALEKFLEAELGIDVEVVVPTNYETIIEGMRFGHIDAAFMDTGPGWITHQRTGAEAVLAELVAGKVNYQATVWALADNDSVNSIEDTVGKRVAFTSITGSSGFVRPMGTLVTDGHITIEGDDIVALESALANNFESYTFAGGYKAALQLLLNGNVDVAFGSDIAPQKYLELEDQVKLRPVTTIGPVPSHVFMVSADMSESTKESLVDALVELNYDEHNYILKDLYGAEALVPTTTTMHIGEFGTFIDSLTGLDQLILDKYNKSK
ncbi:phosphate/phosphite/phosphonate ABC transporter substrate-binding protein [Nitrosopumilus adriaticus]|uniref:Phosphonate ABC transporter periplasmic phosphonate-binding protein n=1 Tax=Nitrosopumilus adriaticus TaxID=1580092 RepID=A0A0D5C249_9ARCH|nr:phosphate/phosphite/phosphonate ABC transporter substrate-binding protein [Nitrosopumilus adriaticus]AJW70864.1 Phosphonate ABC transporter periplasmic phosphonate-binding protein [Nitrosopumilus adriaticus]